MVYMGASTLLWKMVILHPSYIYLIIHYFFTYLYLKKCIAYLYVYGFFHEIKVFVFIQLQGHQKQCSGIPEQLTCMLFHDKKTYKKF